MLVFFLTSSDQGSLVVYGLTFSGSFDAPVPQRIYWATIEGVIAAALLISFGNDALGVLQVAAITIGLTFIVMLIALYLGLYRGLRHEWESVQRTTTR